MCEKRCARPAGLEQALRARNPRRLDWAGSAGPAALVAAVTSLQSVTREMPLIVLLLLYPLAGREMLQNIHGRAYEQPNVAE